MDGLMKYDMAIVGNGFDINCGEPTKYEYFYELIALARKNTEYPDFSKNLNQVFGKLPNYDVDKQGAKKEYYQLGLKSLHTKLKENNYFIDYLIKYKIELETWTAFESLLLEILKKIDFLLNEVRANVYSELDFDEEGIDLELKYDMTNDLEKISIIDELADFNPENKMFSIIKGNDTLKKMELIEDNKKIYVVSIKEKIRKTNKSQIYLRNKLLGAIEKIPYFLMKELKKVENYFTIFLDIFVKVPINIRPPFLTNKLINYNYTKVADELICTNNKVIHIHGKLVGEEYKSNIIFGVDSTNNMSKEFQIFSKRNRIMEMETNYSDFTSFENPKSLAIFGHSLDQADKHTLSVIINNFLSVPNISISSMEFEKKRIYLYYLDDDKALISNKMKLINNLEDILGADKTIELYRNNCLIFVKIDTNNNDTEEYTHLFDRHRRR